MPSWLFKVAKACFRLLGIIEQAMTPVGFMNGAKLFIISERTFKDFICVGISQSIVDHQIWENEKHLHWYMVDIGLEDDWDQISSDELLLCYSSQLSTLWETSHHCEFTTDCHLLLCWRTLMRESMLKNIVEVKVLQDKEII